MKNFRFLFIVLAFAFALFLTPWQSSAAEIMSSSKMAIVGELDSLNPWDIVEESVEASQDTLDKIVTTKEGAEHVTEIISQLLKDKNFANDLTPKLVEILNKCPGLKGGWAKQLGVLNKLSQELEDLGGKLDKLEDFLVGLELATDVAELWSHYQAGDEEAFAEKMADMAIELVAEVVGEIAGGVVKSTVSVAAAAAGVSTGGVGGVIVLAAGWGAGTYVEGKVSEVVEDLLQEHLKDLLLEKGKDFFSLIKNEDISDQLPILPPGGSESGKESTPEKNTAPVQLQKLKVFER